MRSVLRVMVSVVAGFGVLSVPLIRLVWLRPHASTAALPASAFRPVRPHTPSEVALAAGWRHRIQAQQAVNRQRDALEAWDPAVAYTDPDSLRRQLLADDRDGGLRRALGEARRAVALARTRAEACRATLLLARTECDAGHHEAELRHARVLHALARGEWGSRDVLLRALLCEDRLSVQPVGMR
jgi:hypothetical protein